MADKVKLLELDIDMDALLTNVAKLKMNIDELRAKQKTLDTSTLEGAKAFASNSAEIKNLSEQYRIGEGAVRNLTASTNDQVTVTRLVNGEMSKEVNTIKEAQTQNAYLNKIKKDLNVNNKEQKALLDQINGRLDSNTDFIRANSSEQEKQFMNIGNYKSGVSDLMGQLKSGEIGLGGFTKGIWGMTKAFLASPIGWIALAIAALIAIFKLFQPIVDKVEQVFAALNATFDVIVGTIMKVVTGAKSLGSAFKSLGSDMKEAAAAAYELKKAQQDLEDQMEAQEIASSKARAESDKLMAQSKDLSKTESERVKLLQQSEQIMRKDFDNRKKIADQDKANAMEVLRIKTGMSKEEIKLAESDWFAFKENAEKKGVRMKDDLDKYKETIIARNEIEQESNQFIEKNIAKQNTLIEKQQEKEEKARQDSIQRSQAFKDSQIKLYEDEIALFQAQELSKQKSVTETFDYENQLMQKRNDLNAKNYQYGKITKQEFEAEKINILNQFNSATLAATTENLTKELEIWKLQNADLLASKGELSQATIEIEKATQKTLYDKRKEIIDATIQDEQDKQIALLQLENDYKNALTSIDDEWKSIQTDKKQAERDQSASDYEIRLQELQLQTESELVIEQTIYDRKKLLLIQALEDKKITQAQYDAQSLVDKQSFENKIVEIEKQSRMQSMEVSQNAFKTFGELASAFGVKSKGLNIALTTIDTYFAAQKAYMSQFLPVPDPSSPIRGAIAAAGAVASGIARVKQIASTKFASGGFVSGAGTSKSDSINARLSNGESVITAKATSMFRPFLSAMNVAGGGVPFASGGSVGSSALSSVMPTFKVENQTLSADQINDLVDRKINAVKVINVTDETAAVMNAKNKVQNYANV